MTTGISLPQQYSRLGLGMFLHFNMGTFTGLEQGNPNASPSLFNPGSTLSVDNWVAAAQAMGAQYAVLTVKHSDGFCLWPTATTSHSIASASPWYAANGNIDIVSQFVTKFNAAGIKPCLYFSISDATFEQSQGQTLTSYKFYSSSQLAQLQADYSQPAYLSYLQAQITELLTHYGPIFGIWLDAGYWALANTFYPWASGPAMVSFIKGLQPNIVVVANNHNSGDTTNTDIIEWETGNPGAGPAPQELCDTLQINNNWFWHGTVALKSTAAIVASFQPCNLNNCSYLLDCPPDNTGVIPAAMLTALQQIGAAL